MSRTKWNSCSLMIVVLVALCSAFAFLRTISREDKSSNAPVLPAKQMAFRTEYELAVRQNAAWLRNAEDVALHFTGEERLRVAGEQVPRTSMQHLDNDADNADRPRSRCRALER
jgi:hypothetical protein